MVVYRQLMKYRLPLGVLFLGLLSWECAARVSNPMLIPSIWETVISLHKGIWGGVLLIQWGLSIGMVSLCLVLGLMAAILISYGCLKWKGFNEAVDTLSAMAHPLPGMALLPIVILWFGTGVKAVFVILVHAILWPMLLNIKSGFLTMSRNHRDFAQILNLGGFKTLCFIYLPCIFPEVMAGLKTGWARGWRALISAEMIFGAMSQTGGIGWYLFERRVYMDTAGLFSALILIMGTGVLVEYGVFKRIEHRTLEKWGVQR